MGDRGRETEEETTEEETTQAETTEAETTEAALQETTNEAGWLSHSTNYQLWCRQMKVQYLYIMHGMVVLETTIGLEIVNREKVCSCKEWKSEYR